MSKCALDLDLGVAKAWAVCVDTETSACEVSLWLVVGPDAESAADAVARESGDGLSTASLLEGLVTKLGPLGAFPFIDDITAALTALVP